MSIGKHDSAMRLHTLVQWEGEKTTHFKLRIIRTARLRARAVLTRALALSGRRTLKLTPAVGTFSMERSCAVCGSTNSGLCICAGCRKRFYCGVAHQKLDWVTHKPACKVAQATAFQRDRDAKLDAGVIGILQCSTCLAHGRHVKICVCLADAFCETCIKRGLAHSKAVCAGRARARAATVRATAEAGNVKAAGHLGNLYDIGAGVECNKEKALVWWRRAADSEAGDADSANHAGLAYMRGEGVSKDFAAALHYFELAAAEGHANAIANAGFVLINGGYGVARNPEKAATLFRRSADLGDTGAMLNLGILYALGEAVPKDDTRAFSYYLQSAEAGDAKAVRFVVEGYLDGKGVAADPTRAAMWMERDASEPSPFHAPWH